jgi:hypothetical protein
MRKANIEAQNTHLGHAWLEKKKKQQAIERKDCSNKHWLAKHMYPSFSQFYRIGHTSHGHPTHTQTHANLQKGKKNALLVVEVSFLICKTQHKMLVPYSHRVNFFLQKPASQKTLERGILAKRYRYYYD